MVKTFLENGYTVLPGLLSAAEVAELRRVAKQTYHRVKIEGDLAGTVDISHHDPRFRALIAHPRALDVLRSLGTPHYFGHAVIHKPRRERRRNWHQDWWGWAETELSAREAPPQVGILYYLQDTSEAEGCLTVLPGSHRRPTDAQIASLRRDGAQPCPGEVTVPVRAGDGVLLDPRCWHASQANQTLDNRICLTVWYLLDYAGLTPEAQAHAAQGVLWLTELLPELIPPPSSASPADYRRVSMPPWWNE